MHPMLSCLPILRSNFPKLGFGFLVQRIQGQRRSILGHSLFLAVHSLSGPHTRYTLTPVRDISINASSIEVSRRPWYATVGRRCPHACPCTLPSVRTSGFRTDDPLRHPAKRSTSFHRRTHHLIQMRTNLPPVAMNHRVQRLQPARCCHSRFHDWLHHKSCKDLAPPACKIFKAPRQINARNNLLHYLDTSSKTH